MSARGLYAIVAKAWSPSLEIAGVKNVFAWSPTLGGAIGAIYGAFVEIDDGVGDDKSAKTKEKPKPARKPS